MLQVQDQFKINIISKITVGFITVYTNFRFETDLDPDLENMC